MNNEELTRENRLEALTAPLLAWFCAGARDLPWRRTADPYRIWVSEIMLQQTRVAAVLGYYDRFLAEFPTVEALADAPEERLFKLWEGLGYYSRARNLQKAARVVAQQYGGRFPASFALLRTLPGVGDYTAGAVASAAFALPEPAVDGNVLRVLSRVLDCHDSVSLPPVKAAFRELLRPAMPGRPEEIRIFNQAYMELGATVCVPNGAPSCEDCPARALCLARRRNTVLALPVKGAKKPRRVEEKTVFVLLREGRIALRQRPDTGLLASLWEFPNAPGDLEESAAAAAVRTWGLEPLAWREKLTARHIFTHVEWHMTGYVLQVTGSGVPELLWADAPAFARCAVPSAFARYTAAAQRLLCPKEE